MHKLLQCYPFSDRHIQLVEGFSAYDGVIGDEPGTPHKGIDYVLNINGGYVPFDVHAMHEGMTFQGVSESWENFVIVYAAADGKQFSTIYAHLHSIDPTFPQQYVEQDGQKVRNRLGALIVAGQRIGVAGTSGWAQDIIQLHIELHEKDLETGTSRKLDPYGIDDRASSGRYPQPGHTLHGLDHAWVSDEPTFPSSNPL